MIIAVHSEVLLKSLVCALSLTITLRVIPRGEVQTHVECLTECASEVKHKFCTMIKGDMIRNSVFGIDTHDEQEHELLRVNGVNGRNEYSLL